jgi:hypothetical protein
MNEGRDTEGGIIMSKITSLRAGAALAAVTTALVCGAAQAATPDQLSSAGWTCIQPRLDPTKLLCAPPGQGLPPLPGTAGFDARAPSYEFTVFEFGTGAFVGTEHLLRPDIYANGKPPCPQQPGGEYLYNARNDLWFCLRAH